MIHRISVTGAQGTGKSTLASAIADRLRRDGREVALYRGLGDEVIGGHLMTGASAGAESVRAFVRRHREREESASGAIQIFDRCLLDALAYACVLDCIPQTEFEDLRLAVIESCSRLTRLLWLRVTLDYPVLSPADESPEFRRAVDAAIGSVARDNDIVLFEHAIPPERIDDIALSMHEFITGRSEHEDG